MVLVVTKEKRWEQRASLVDRRAGFRLPDPEEAGKPTNLLELLRSSRRSWTLRLSTSTKPHGSHESVKKGDYNVVSGPIVEMVAFNVRLDRLEPLQPIS
jgi:hypothetical protein